MASPVSNFHQMVRRSNTNINWKFLLFRAVLKHPALPMQFIFGLLTW
jgi:hypothetical protein